MPFLCFNRCAVLLGVQLRNSVFTIVGKTVSAHGSSRFSKNRYVGLLKDHMYSIHQSAFNSDLEERVYEKQHHGPEDGVLLELQT